MLKQFVKGRVAVFVDAANVFYSQKKLGWKVSYKKLKEYFDRECDLKSIHMYTAVDRENLNQVNFFKGLKHIGIDVIEKPLKVIYGSDGKKILKGNLDVELSMGMIDRKEQYDVAVLMSGDSDFSAVVDRLKSQGKQIIVMSTKGHVSKELMERSISIDLQDLRKEIEYKE